MSTDKQPKDLDIPSLRSRFNQKIYENMKTTGSQQLDLALIWQDSDDLAVLYAQLDELKACLDSFRPFSASEVQILRDYFDIEYTYHSNKIEGNTLTKSETGLVINKGITIGNKSLHEHLEAINHKEAIDFIRELVDKATDFTAFDLLNIHQLILRAINPKDAGKYRQQDVMIAGSQFMPPSHLFVNELMSDYFDFYQQQKNHLHPVELASEMHERLVTIHPFIDGNGRTARLVMNLLLLKNGYPITIIEGDNDKRTAYYDSLEIAQIGQDSEKLQFKRLIANQVKQMLFRYLTLLASNNNDDRLDKGDEFFNQIQSLL